MGIRKLKKVTHIGIHCAATKPTQLIGVDAIRRWHTDPKPKGRGWADIGYHFVITRSGEIQSGRPIHLQGAHIKGHNKHSIGVCLVGGLDHNGTPENNFTSFQFKSLKTLVKALKILYPKVIIQGHRDFPKVRKDCPCFDVAKWRKKANV